jgi:PAS domain S-box-containing protein
MMMAADQVAPPSMPILSRRSTQLLIWALIALAGLAAGWWSGRRVRTRFLRELIDDAQRCAIAFREEEMHALTGTPVDLANPAYVSVKARLVRFRSINPRIRLVSLIRHWPDTGRTILLADSESPDSKRIANPGDEYGGAMAPRRRQSILRGGLPAFAGPSSDALGTWLTGYALISEQPSVDGRKPSRDLLALDITSDHWWRDLGFAGFTTAGSLWLLLGLFFGGLLVLRREFGRSDLIRKLSQAVEQSRSAIVITGVDRRIEYVNAGLCAITGWRREEMAGQPMRMLTSDETTDEQFAEIFETITAGRTWRGETINRRRDNSTYPARSTISPVYDRGGRLTHIIAVVEDITDRKQVEATLIYAKERAEGGERAKGQFLAAMSHEIRTPLNGIIGFSSLLLDTPLSPEQREYLLTIRNSGGALLQLTSDVLDYSQIDADRLQLELQPCDPWECVEGALEFLAPRAAENGLELLHSAEGLPSLVLTDASRLRQVLINLVGNAIKFTSTGEVEVTATAARLPPLRAGSHPPEAPPPGNMWRLTFAVRDTGIGISPGDRSKLFKPFSQIDSSSTRRYGGAGLGLAISHSLVQLMGGEISVESEVGRGTTFTFTIVVAEVAGARVQPEPSALHGRTLAVFSTSASLRRELVQLVAIWGARPIECSHEELAAAPWELALIDLVAADTEVWQQIFAQRPELPSRPLVALVPVDFPGTEREVLRGYFRAFVHKPARHEALRLLVSTSFQPEGAGGPASAPES